MTDYSAAAHLRDFSGRTVLYRAVQDGQEHAVRAILASTAKSPDLLDLAQTVNGWTPLFVACVNGHLKIIEFLLKAGAS